MLRAKAKASKRRAILNAAERQFALRSYQDVLLEEIAGDAEVAKGTVYLYFKSKADLYLALIAESYAPMIEHLEERATALAETSAWAAIELIIKELIAFKAKNTALHEALRESSRASQEDVFCDLKKSVLSLIERTLRQGIKRGEIADPAPEATADLILATIPRASLWMAGKRNKWTAQTTAAHLLKIFGEGLLVERK